MRKIIAGSLNIDASDDWMKFMPNCFKCLRASGDDLSVVEIVKICIKGVDKVNEANTIAKSRAEQSRAEQSRAEQSRAEQRLGCLNGFGGGSFAGQVYEKNGLAPTLTDMQGGGRQPHVVEVKKMDANELGFIEHGTGKHQSNTVFGTDGISPAITTIEGGGTQQIKVVDIKSLRMVRTEEGKAMRKDYESGKIHHGFNEFRTADPREDGVSNTITTVQKDNMVLEQCIVAMRGRNPENPSDRAAGIELEQKLEPQEDGICNTLTSVQKDNLVLEKCYIAYDDYNSKIPEDQSVSPTLTTNCGASALRNGVKMIKVRQATKEGFALCELGGGGGFGLSIIGNSQRQGDRERTDKPDADNGEYP